MARSRSRGATVSLSEAARLLGKHRNTLAAWLDHGAPCHAGSDGTRAVHLGAILRWREERAQAEAAERWSARVTELEALAGFGQLPEHVSEAEARRRKRVAEARLAELRTAREEGSLVPGDDLQRTLVHLAMATRSRILAVPSKLAQALAAAESPAEAHKIVEEGLTEALEELADEGERAAERLESDDPTHRGPGPHNTGE